MDDKKILDGMIPNCDNYKLRDINCFYKPMGIIHRYFKDDYNNLFLCLMSAYCIFVQDDPFEYYDRFYNQTFSQLFNLKIEGKKIENKEAFINELYEAIDNDNPVLVEVDQFYIYYSENYLSKHVYHYIPISGYDRKKDLFYCLDILHDDNKAMAIYKNDVITSDLLWNAFTKNKFYVYQKIGPMREYQEIKNDYLKMYQSYFQKKQLTIDTFRDKDKFEFQNTRVVYYSELINLLEKVNQDSDLRDKFNLEKNELMKQWEKTKLLSIYKSNKENEQYNFIDSFSEAENRFHKKFFNIIMV